MGGGRSREEQGIEEERGARDRALEQVTQAAPKAEDQLAAGASPHTTIPGEPLELSTKLLDVGRDAMQTFTPIKAVHEHVCGFHFYANDMSRQVCMPFLRRGERG